MGTFPGYTTKSTLVDLDKVWGYDSEGNANVDITLLVIYNYLTNKIDTDAVSEGSTNLYYTQARFDTALAAKNTDSLSEGTTNKYASTTNVNAAGATMNTDTTLAGNGYFLDEDDLVSDSATKVPSQQSVKAYVDNFDFVKTNTITGTITFPNDVATPIVIAHGLGRIPRQIHSELKGTSNLEAGSASYDGTTITQSVYNDIGATTVGYNTGLFYQGHTGVSNFGKRTISAIDATNITISYTDVGTKLGGVASYKLDFIG